MEKVEVVKAPVALAKKRHRPKIKKNTNESDNMELLLYSKQKKLKKNDESFALQFGALQRAEDRNK